MADRDGIVVEFQNFTGVDDLSMCIAILEQHDWNLQEAVQNIMASHDSPQHMDVSGTRLNPPSSSVDGSGPSGCPTGSLIDPIPIDDIEMDTGGDAGRGFSQIHNDLTGHGFDGSSGQAGLGLSTGLRLGPTQNALRLLTFYIQYRERVVTLSVHDHETVGRLKELLSVEMNIPTHFLELHGWPNKSDAMVRDSDLLRQLRLPKENTLYLLTPELPQGSDTAAVQRVMEDDLAARVFGLSIHHVEEDKTYTLNYPAQRTIHEVKVDVYTLTNINVRHQVWDGWPDVSDSTTLGDSGICHPTQVLSVRSCGPSTSGSLPSLARPPLHAARNPASSSSANEIEVDSEEESLEHDDVEIIDTDDICRSARPLMPSNCSHQQEAVEHFYREFSRRYGEPHPVFFIGSLEDAIKEALQCKAKERKLLAIYLHHDNSIQANVFCSQILCTEQMVEYLAHNYILWAWDLTCESNKNVLLQLCTQYFGTVASNTVKAFKPDQLPLMLLISRTRGTNEVLQVIQGNETLDHCMSHLMHVVELSNPQKQQDIQEEEEREARDRMLAEQDAAYQESLAVDRAKMESRRLLEESQKQKEEEEHQRRQTHEMKLQEEEALKQALQQSLASQLPPEPPAGSAESTTIRVKCPDGQMKTRRFLGSNSLQVLFDYITSEGFHIDEYKVLTTFPRKDLKQLESSKSLKDSQLYPQETVILEKL